MYGILTVAATGLTSVLQYPLRSLATVACLLAVLVPFVAGQGLSRGLEQEAEDSARLGADLYVTGEQFGRDVPLPVTAAGPIRDLDGVRDVVPRVVAHITLGKDAEEAILVGLPADHFPAGLTCIEGRLPRPGSVNELIVGTELARRLHLQVGALIPPFYHNDRGEHLSRVVGLFRSDVPLWQARLILTPLDTALAICNQEGLATDLLVFCRPGYGAEVRQAIRRLPPLTVGPAKTGLRVTSREDLLALLPRGLFHREGIFDLHWLLAFAVGILAILVTSGVGMAERRREVGILKATGWQTDEVLLRGLVESVVLGVAGAALAVLLAFVWLRLFNGYGIAGLFLAGVGVRPSFAVPCRLAPVPVLLAALFALALVLVGTLSSTWRAAVVPPREAMR